MKANDTARQVLECIVRPTLEYLGLHSLAAERLVLFTGAHEGRGFDLIEQIAGPALSWWQIEPDTYQDLLANSMPGIQRARPVVAVAYRGLIRHRFASYPPAEELARDPMLACATCRLLYYRKPEPLPHADDLPGLAAYWKQHYNTRLGDGRVVDFMRWADWCGDLWT